MEALLALTLFGSVVWFWIFVSLFIIICFISDLAENGVIAFISLLIISMVFYINSDIKTILSIFTLTSVLSYFLIGLLFSVFRTFVAGRKLAKEISHLPSEKGTDYSGHGTKEREIKDYIQKEMKGNVFRWWFMWPISLITWLSIDFIIDLYEAIYRKVSKFYNYVLDLGIKSIGL